MTMALWRERNALSSLGGIITGFVDEYSRWRCTLTKPMEWTDYCFWQWVKNKLTPNYTEGSPFEFQPAKRDLLLSRLFLSFFLTLIIKHADSSKTNRQKSLFLSHESLFLSPESLFLSRENSVCLLTINGWQALKAY